MPRPVRSGGRFRELVDRARIHQNLCDEGMASLCSGRSCAGCRAAFALLRTSRGGLPIPPRKDVFFCGQRSSSPSLIIRSPSNMIASRCGLNWRDYGCCSCQRSRRWGFFLSLLPRGLRGGSASWTDFGKQAPILFFSAFEHFRWSASDFFRPGSASDGYCGMPTPVALTLCP